MLKRCLLLLCVPVMMLLAACAGMQGGFAQPTVTVSSFRMLPSNTAVPRFEIGLQVSNPNRTELRLQGIVYNIDLEGHRILSGVSNQLPVIPAYGTGDVLLQASPDLLSTIALFTDLFSQRRETLQYTLDADIDIGGLLRRVHIERSGAVPLTGLRR